jgi:hypothetical protein
MDVVALNATADVRAVPEVPSITALVAQDAQDPILEKGFVTLLEWANGAGR